jgi:prepilin-type N-terminal cleavage/methylation domain-containing protein
MFAHPIKQRKGFTLIELVTIIIIIALLSSIAVPAYTRLTAHVNYLLEVQKLRSFLLDARGHAVKYHTTVTVTWDPSQGTFTETEDQYIPDTDQPTALSSSNSGLQNQLNTTGAPFAQNSQGSYPNGQNLNAQQTNTFTLEDGMDVSDFQTDSSTISAANMAILQSSGQNVNNTIQFNPDGSCTQTSFSLVSQDGYGTSFQFYPPTGRLEISDLGA